MKFITLIMCISILLCGCDKSINNHIENLIKPPIIGTLSQKENDIAITDALILKYNNYFINKPGIFFITNDNKTSFSEISFDSTSELSDENLMIFAAANLLPSGEDSDGYCYWDRIVFEKEIQNGLNRQLKDINTVGVVRYIPEEDIFKSIGFSFDGDYATKVISLTKGKNGLITGVFDFYSVFDYYLSVNQSPVDLNQEILKDYSGILNSEMCKKVRKTIVFLEKYDKSNEMYLEYISIK